MRESDWVRNERNREVREDFTVGKGKSSDKIIKVTGDFIERRRKE